MNKLSTCLWFNTEAEEAAKFYTAIFKNAHITEIVHNTEATPTYEAGTVLTVGFTLEGQQYMALNGGPQFSFTEAISLVVNCDSQEEIDYYWDKLREGGQETACGWLKDRYGISWQIVPRVLPKLLQDKNREKAQRVMQALMNMKKLDIATLQQA
jgi:predicted 3-demethylubiquinone-9 3-methyltransferase (glyoxalase superfamily)